MSEYALVQERKHLHETLRRMEACGLKVEEMQEVRNRLREIAILLSPVAT